MITVVGAGVIGLTAAVELVRAGHEVRVDAPATAEHHIDEDRALETRDGWPVRIVRATILAADGRRVLERRLAAFYAFQAHGAVAMLRLLGDDGVATRAEGIFLAARRARSPVGCLGD